MESTRKIVALVLVLGLATAATAQQAPGDDVALLGKWRLTTLVDKEAEKLRGVNGYYELIVGRSGDKVLAAVAKVGHTGKDYAPRDLMAGVAEAQVERDERGQTTNVRLEVVLRSPSGTVQPMLFELTLDREGALGYWALTGADSVHVVAEDTGTVEHTVFGAARAIRGSGPRVRLRPDTPLPCRLSCDIRFRCGGMGPGGCNSSNSCLDACEPEGGGARRGAGE